MKTSKNILILTMLAAAVSCSVSREIGIRQGYAGITRDSSGVAGIDIDFEIPKGYIPVRSRLIIQPFLETADSVYSEGLDPLVIDARIFRKKMQRASVLDGYIDSLAEFATEYNPAEIYFRYIGKTSAGASDNGGGIYAAISSHGCGRCGIIDTLQLGFINDPVTLLPVKEALKIDWIEPEYKLDPKIRTGKGEARLQFGINQYDINLELAGNREEMDRMLNSLKTVTDDSLATLDKVNIYGLASADGPFAFNTTLSRNRAISARDWLVSRIGRDKISDSIFTVNSRPEGWWPVYEAMRKAGDQNASKVYEIIRDSDGTENDDIYETAIRSLDCWPEIRRSYLQKDRKVEYEYEYTVRGFSSDEELKAMYRTRPDAFSIDEFLRLSSIMETTSGKMEVYRTLLHFFPQSSTGINNLAVLYLKNGDEKGAREVLDRGNEYSAEMLRTRAASYVYEGEYEKAAELIELSSDRSTQARYNLGLIRIKMRQLEEGYELLRPYGDVNSAIAALCVNHNEEAASIIEECKDDSPLACYVLALAAARTGDSELLFSVIGRAFGDDNLKKRALTEYDFRKYIDTEEFKEALNGKAE